MKEFDYSLNNETLEIFPAEFSKNPLIVYHGTTSYHSKNIEENGFCVNTPPYNIDKVKILVETLKSADFSKYDVKKGFLNWTTAFGIEHYLDAIEKKEFRTSFLPVSYACAAYTKSQTKGGQAFRDIREAKTIIEFAIQNDPSLENKVPDEVTLLFSELYKVDNSQGVIYAVKLPEELKGIECDINNVVYSNRDISKEHIIGKINIPENPTELEIEQNAINQKIKSKLHGNGGLGVIIWRKQNE
jgi:hypothetical protein